MTSFPSEISSYRDRFTGVPVRQLTNYKAHSHHLYFTNPGWFDDGRRMLFGSDRNNQTNLFSVDLESGLIAQHTQGDNRTGIYQVAALNPNRPEAYFWRGRELMAIDLHGNRERKLYRMEDGFNGGLLNVTSDGRSICTAMTEDLSARINMDLGNGYVGMDEYWAANPTCFIVAIPVDGGPAREVWRETSWIGHVNTSPTQPNILTYCHEGKWEKVDQRIWGLDLSTGRRWPIRERKVAGERIGHEYWLAGGVHVGYHGSRPDGSKLLGIIRYDNTGEREIQFPHHTQHIHSNTPDLIVGDGNGGGKFVRLWKWNGTTYDGPRVLCEHCCSGHSQVLHVHPRFSPDGGKIIFTSDRTGYGQVYEADVPPFESLPALEALT